MLTVLRGNPVLAGVAFALAGTVVFSINDLAIKALSGDYALHQVMLIRAMVGLTFILALALATRADLRQVLTRRPGAHALRLAFVLVSNVTYFMGLAALPLADAVAISFVSPLIITALSVPVLGERVGPRRWVAVVIGMLGVLVMTRPGEGAISWAAVLVLISAFCYACVNLMTVRMKTTESALTLSFWVQVAFLVTSLCVGLAIGDGRLAASGDPALAFLLRAWIWPPPQDWPAFLATGLSVTIGGLMVAQAYRLAPASSVAPFEYAAVPMAVFWGVTVLGTWPDATGWLGIALILGAGIYALMREAAGRGRA
jgi:drug/metabolite transporter (DMT)-like permease